MNVIKLGLRSIGYFCFLLFILPLFANSQITFLENGQKARLGPDPGLFPDSPTRSKIDLSGSWKYSLDGAKWENVTIPSAYDGTAKVTFTRTFDITSSMLDTYAFSLVVYGINYQSEITINGSFVGRHLGGYSSLVIPIQPNILQVGSENAIIVTVDNELTPKTTLPLRQQVTGWKTYGGIFRDLYILAVPKLSVESAEMKSVITASGRQANVTIQADIVDRWSGIRPGGGMTIGVQAEVFDKLTGMPVARSGVSSIVPQPNKSVETTLQLTIDSVKRWSPDVPDLYVIKCQVVKISGADISLIDEYSFDAGVREFAWKDGRLHVNKTLTPIKGILWHEMHPASGSSMRYDAMERDIASIKSLGANLIRFQYPPHPYVINMCDRYGLMVLEDIPLVGVPGEILDKDYFRDLATSYLREMIARDKGHASILAWGIGDQFETNSSHACEYVTSARSLVRSLDDRPVYFATGEAQDRCMAEVDVIGLSSFGEEASLFKERLISLQQQYPAKPIIVARYGREVEPGNRGGYSDPRSFEAQARHIMKYYELFRETRVAGSVLWSFNDWRADRPALTTSSDDPYLRTMGIVSESREKRVAFDVTRALFNGEKVQALPVGNYSPGAPIIYVFAGLSILISLAFFYNANRRFRDSVNRSLFRTYNFFADVRDQRILTYTQNIFLILVVSLTWATILSSILSHYRTNVLLDNLLSQFLSDNIKEWLVLLIWDPPQFIGVFCAIIAVKIVAITLLVMLFSLTVRTYVYFYHAFSISVWSMLPYIMLIPLAMILYRLMESQAYVLPVLAILAIFTVWVFLRLLKGISIIYDVYPGKVYAGGLLFVILGAVVLYAYFDYTQSTSLYLKYLLHTVNISA